MKPRFILAPEAARDLAEIWNYLEHRVSIETADRVERVIRDRLLFLCENPGVGHQRRDLTSYEVKFFQSFPIWWCITRKPHPYKLSRSFMVTAKWK